jgi:type VI protein secretion system component Hcp
MPIAAQYLELFDQSMARVAGEAEATGFVGQIEVSDWNWRVENKELKDAGGKGTGQGSRIEPSIFSFSKGADRSTVRLIQAMHNGEIFRKANFTLTEELAGSAEATGGEFHLCIELTEIIVLKYDLQVRSADLEVTLEETWELSYKNIVFKYDQGAHQVTLTRPPGANDESGGSPVDELAKKAKDLNVNERQELIKRLGQLDGKP